VAATASPFGALSVVIPAMGSAQRAARRQAPAADPMRRGPAATKIVSGITDHPLEPVIAPAEGETWLRMTTAQCGTAGAAQICGPSLSRSQAIRSAKIPSPGCLHINVGE